MIRADGDVRRNQNFSHTHARSRPLPLIVGPNRYLKCPTAPTCLVRSLFSKKSQKPMGTVKCHRTRVNSLFFFLFLTVLFVLLGFRGFGVLTPNVNIHSTRLCLCDFSLRDRVAGGGVVDEFADRSVGCSTSFVIIAGFGESNLMRSDSLRPIPLRTHRLISVSVVNCFSI